MNDQFKVGTICIGQNFVENPKRNGMECEIIGDLDAHIGKCCITDEIVADVSYDVRWSDGTERFVRAHFLRLPPPKHKEWADEAIRKLKKQSSDHIVIGKTELIPEEAL